MKDKNNFSFISNQGKVSICCAEQCYGFLNVTLNVSFHLFSDSLRLSLHQPHKYRGQRIFLSTFFMWKFTGLFTQYSTPSTQYKRVFIKITMITDEGAVNRNIFSFSVNRKIVQIFNFLFQVPDRNGQTDPRKYAIKYLMLSC